MIHQIESVLTEYISSTSPVDVNITRDTDLLTNNVLDSLMLMEIVLVIEHEWSIRLDGDDIAPANFRSIGNLAGLVLSRVANTGVAAA